jgi:anaerobic magnesium-protoporphyrin IX monomethyl ester cyclase
MTEILCGQPYYLGFDPKLNATKQPYPPLGALYAASYLRERGHSATSFDAMLAQSEAEWDHALDSHHPLIAIHYEDSFNYLSKMYVL